MARWREHRKEAASGIGYGWHKDGKHFGCNMELLCSTGYRYVGSGKGADTWYMFIMDDTADDNGYRRKTSGDRNDNHVCHMLLSKSAFKAPKSGVKGHTAKVDLTTPGLEAYYQPQLVKRTDYVSPEKYYSMPAGERIYYRTKKQHRKNDYKRAEIRARQKAARNRHKEDPKYPYDESYYSALMEMTYKDDEVNPMYGCTGYTSDLIYGYREIILDIDGHDLPDEWCQQLCDDFATLLVRGCDKSGEIICDVLPDTVVKTGRGLHLHFKFQSVSYKAVSMVRKVCDRLTEIYDALVKELYPDLDLDIPASKSLAKVCRMPGSYNWKTVSQNPTRFGQMGYRVTELKSKIIDRNHQRSIEDYMSALGIPAYKNAVHKTASDANDVADAAEKKGKKYTKDSTIKHSAGRGKKYIPFLRDYVKNISVGQRNTFIFNAGTLAKEADEDVEQFLMELNSLLPKPLPYSEVRATIRSVEKRNYHIRTRTINESIGADESDLMPYGLTMDGAAVDNETKKRERREKREARNHMILDLIAAGKPVYIIAEIAGVCRETVRKVRDAAEAEAGKVHEHYEKIKRRNAECAKNLRTLMPHNDRQTNAPAKALSSDNVCKWHRVILTS